MRLCQIPRSLSLPKLLTKINERTSARGPRDGSDLLSETEGDGGHVLGASYLFVKRSSLCYPMRNVQAVLQTSCELFHVKLKRSTKPCSFDTYNVHFRLPRSIIVSVTTCKDKSPQYSVPD